MLLYKNSVLIIKEIKRPLCILIAAIQCPSKLHKLFALNSNSKTFDSIYSSFIPKKDYYSLCFRKGTRNIWISLQRNFKNAYKNISSYFETKDSV